MSSSQSNKLGQIYVEWDIKTQILRYVSACSVVRNSNCTNSTFCIETHLNKKTFSLMVVVLHCEDCGSTSEHGVFGSLQGHHLGLHVVVHHLCHHICSTDAASHLQHVDTRLRHAEHQVLCIPHHLEFS